MSYKSLKLAIAKTESAIEVAKLEAVANIYREVARLMGGK